METKFKLIETEDYILAVSDEDASNSCIYFTGNPTGIFKTGIKYKNEAGNYFYQDAITGMSNTYLAEISKKIIGCLPKGNAPGLLHIVKLPSDENVNVQKISRLPLLPEIVVKDDIVEKLAFEYDRNRTGTWINWDVKNGFINGHKAATKVYSEEDLKKVINMTLREFVKDYQLGKPLLINEYENNAIQSLRQPKTPKWFVAEMTVVSDEIDHIYSGNIRYGLKTTTINNKTYLEGTYLN